MIKHFWAFDVYPLHMHKKMLNRACIFIIMTIRMNMSCQHNKQQKTKQTQSKQIHNEKTSGRLKHEATLDIATIFLYGYLFETR